MLKTHQYVIVAVIAIMASALARAGTPSAHEAALKIAQLEKTGNYTDAYNIARDALRLNPDNKELLEAEKKLVWDDYRLNYLGSSLHAEPMISLGWTGSVDKCDPGTINPQVNARLLQRLKYFRHMAGIPDEVVLNEELNRKCQQAALMMMANNSLSHNPPRHWHCYTDDGAQAAGSSNISWGYNSVDALRGQMEDDGDFNTATGHRRWILYPGLKVFGHGSVDNAMALWTQPENYGLDVDTSYENSHYVAWPPAGYVPQELVFSRWSFSLMGADFSKATVTATADGHPLGVKKEPLAEGFGMNTLVWTMEAAGSNTGIKITIRNVVLSDGKKKNFSYTVMPMTAE
jgi:uncharacterized protein YkwD